MTTTTTTLERVKNYQGKNTFVIKMKETIKKYGKLTVNQEAAVEKCLNSEINLNDVDNLPDNVKKIVEYKGENKFVLDIQEKLKSIGGLSPKQIEVVEKQIDKEVNENKMIMVKWGAPGETIELGRKIGQQLKKDYNLNFNPILIDVTKVLGISAKSVKFQGKMTIKRGNVCMCCNKTLTDEFSMLTKLGKTCAKHMKIEYITDKSQAERLRNDYLNRVEEIGLMEFTVPKGQIKKWEGGVTEQMVKSLSENLV